MVPSGSYTVTPKEGDAAVDALQPGVGDAGCQGVLAGAVFDVHRDVLNEPAEDERAQPLGAGTVGVQLDGVAHLPDAAQKRR